MCQTCLFSDISDVLSSSFGLYDYLMIVYVWPLYLFSSSVRFSFFEMCIYLCFTLYLLIFNLFDVYFSGCHFWCAYLLSCFIFIFYPQPLPLRQGHPGPGVRFPPLVFPSFISPVGPIFDIWRGGSLFFRPNHGTHSVSQQLPFSVPFFGPVFDQAPFPGPVQTRNGTRTGQKNAPENRAGFGTGSENNLGKPRCCKDVYRIKNVKSMQQITPKRPQTDSQTEPKINKNWSKDGSRNGPEKKLERSEKMIRRWTPKIDPYPKTRPRQSKTGPRQPKTSPRQAQDSPRQPKAGPKTAQAGPRQPKTSPRQPKRP